MNFQLLERARARRRSKTRSCPEIRATSQNSQNCTLQQQQHFETTIVSLCLCSSATEPPRAILRVEGGGFIYGRYKRPGVCVVRSLLTAAAAPLGTGSRICGRYIYTHGDAMLALLTRRRRYGVLFLLCRCCCVLWSATCLDYYMQRGVVIVEPMGHVY